MRGRWGALVVAALFAGCAAQPDVSRQPGSVDPGAATFTLTVEVVSATIPPRRLAGASVSSGSAVGNLTSGTTDASGQVALELVAPQIVALEVGADGYAAAGTVPLEIGELPPQGSFQRDMDSLGRGLSCVFSFGLVCPVDATMRLPGTSGQVTIRLVPASVTRELEMTFTTAVTSPATGQTGYVTDVPYAGTPDLDALYGAQLARVDGVLAWTNAPGSQADLQFFLACGGTQVQTDPSGPASLVALGARELALTLEPSPACGPLAAGAWVSTASTDLVAHATLVLAFDPGIQRPVA